MSQDYFRYSEGLVVGNIKIHRQVTMVFEWGHTGDGAGDGAGLGLNP